MGWLPDIKPNSLVLARTNMLVLGIERELLERRVPYTKLGSRGTGAWKTPVAEALRVWKKWQSGEKLTDVDEMAVLKACNNYHRSKIEEGALHEVLRGPWQDALVCSDRMMDFYEDVLPYIDSEITVRLGTVHASKGMEADNVYLNAEKTMKVMESAELDPDSEIRVEYVGMTRARHELTIIGENK
jgi:superfamily I DNA/RNA helicase